MLAEGVTAFFTDCVLQDEGFGNFNDAYRDQKKKAETLMKGLNGNPFDVTASFNFNYEFLKMATALGLTTKQFVALGTGGFKELAEANEGSIIVYLTLPNAGGYACEDRRHGWQCPSSATRARSRCCG